MRSKVCSVFVTGCCVHLQGWEGEGLNYVQFFNGFCVSAQCVVLILKSRGRRRKCVTGCCVVLCCVNLAG